MERNASGKSGFFILGLLMLGICAPMAWAQASLETIDGPQGGEISYGAVDGANSLADALAGVLRSVHKSSGEKPLIGRAFKLRYTNSVAVFFTVVDHSEDNTLFAGLLIAAATGPKKVEAALVTDEASRFGKSVNPMLKALSDNWHPSGMKADTDPTWCGYSSRGSAPQIDAKTLKVQEAAAAKRWTDELAVLPQNNAQNGPPVALHLERPADCKALVNIPDGWKIRPDNGSGAIVVTGPNGEAAGLNMTRLAVDPASREQSLLQANGDGKKAEMIVYPADADIAKAFPDLLQQWRKLNGLDPAELVIDHAVKLPTPQGERCAHVTGRMNPDGKGMQEMNSIVCATEAVRGKYMVLLFHTLLPLAVADQERATMSAILASFRLDISTSQRPDIEPPGHEAWLRLAQSELGLYGTIEREFNTSGAVISAQGCHPSDPWGLNIYLIDPPVIESGGKDGAGWKSAAEVAVKADPERYGYVETQDYLKGMDY